MNKTTLLILGALIIIAGGFYLFNNQENPVTLQEGDTAEFRGTVIQVETEAAAVDGPVLITIESETKERFIIAVPSMGLPLCAAFENIADVYALKQGDEVSVRGQIDAQNHIVPCEHTDHYLQTAEGQGLTEIINEESGLSFAYRQQPNGYILQQPTWAAEHPNFVEAYTLMLKSDFKELQQRQNGEGPPTINIMIFQNSENQWSRQWADQNLQISNLNLLLGEVQETVVGGANAIRYTADGLYVSDNVVVASGGYVFVLSGSYLEKDSQIHQDFKTLVDTIQLDQQPS